MKHHTLKSSHQNQEKQCYDVSLQANKLRSVRQAPWSDSTWNRFENFRLLFCCPQFLCRARSQLQALGPTEGAVQNRIFPVFELHLQPPRHDTTRPWQVCAGLGTYQLSIEWLEGETLGGDDMGSSPALQSQDSGVLAPLLVWKDLALASIRVILGPLSLCGVFLTITSDKRVLLEMRVMFF